jgi:flavin reductase (DIM6/NTAB) family NADH-FMN oxidoreductase RutF
MPEKYRKELNYCGTISGRDENKIEKCGFTVEKENDVPYFAEARLTLICKKLYAKELSEDGFIEKKYVDTFYSDKDWHVMYIAEIEKVLVE